MATLDYPVKLELSFKDFQRVKKVIFDHCGIDLCDGKRALVNSRLAKRTRTMKFGAISSYIDHVLSNDGKEEFINFVDSLSTNLTSFYRENDHFEYLSKTLLPQILKSKIKQKDYKLRIWSAGCSSGEEPYTLSIILNEHIPNIERWDAKILATDISTKILNKCTTGVYDDKRVKTVAPSLRDKYFSKINGSNNEYMVNDKLRSLITFNYLNLMEKFPFNGPFDCIFCRNVMIYFNKQTQEDLINRYTNLLTPDGVLFIGHSESLSGVQHNLEYVLPSAYKRK